jgi:hypothetical protein
LNDLKEDSEARLEEASKEAATPATITISFLLNVERDWRLGKRGVNGVLQVCLLDPHIHVIG